MLNILHSTLFQPGIDIYGFVQDSGISSAY